MTISDAQKQEIKDKAKLDDIFRGFVQLLPAGRGTYKCLCPFHSEKTPSLHLRPDIGSWHCFGCGAGGDVISFVEKINNLDFVEALEYLASKTGVKLVQSEYNKNNKSGNIKKTDIYNCIKDANIYYREHLKDSELGKKFLTDKGFTPENAKQFGIGYAPKGWSNLTDYLRQKKGYSTQILLDSGLVNKGEKGIYDKFRDRLIWPIKNNTGDTVAFGARKLSDDDKIVGKYINSPETIVFSKSNIMYYSYESQKEMSEKGQAVIVEGYTDVMAMHLSGIKIAVSTSGTSLTEGHIKRLKTIIGDDLDNLDGKAKEIIFVFDGDEAGQKAAIRAFSFIDMINCSVFVCPLEDKLDPCDIRQKYGDKYLNNLVSNKKIPIFQFILNNLTKNVIENDPHSKKVAIDKITPVLKKLKNKNEQNEYIEQISEKMKVDSNVIKERFTNDISVKADVNQNIDIKINLKLEDTFFALILQYPAHIKPKLLDRTFYFSDKKYSKLFSVIKQTGSVSIGKIDVISWIKEIENLYNSDLSKFLNMPILDHQNIDNYAKITIDSFYKESIDSQIKILEAKMKNAKSDDEKTKLLQEKTKLEKEKHI